MIDLPTRLKTLELFSSLKKSQLLNPLTARLLARSHALNHKSLDTGRIEAAIALSASLKSDPFDPPDESASGSILLGYAENKIPIGINPEECHVLIAGMTGSGKSTLLKLIFAQAQSLGIPFWLFVRAKDLRTLIGINNNIIINNFNGGLKFNPMNPCGIPKRTYINIFSEIFIQSNRLYDGTKNYLIDNLAEIYEKTQDNGLPTLQGLYEQIKSKKHFGYSRTMAYKESALNRLGGLLFGPLGNVFDSQLGHEEHFLENNCIFEIDRLTNEQQVFVVNLLIMKLFNRRLSQDNTNWFFVGVDDGNLLFDASFEHRADLGLPIIHHLLSTVRKSKINIFCCTQTPHQVGASIHSNSGVKITMSLANGSDIDGMQRSIGNLSKEQKEHFYKLKRQQMIVKNSFHSSQPVFCTVPDVIECEAVSDFSVAESNERILLKNVFALPASTTISVSVELKSSDGKDLISDNTDEKIQPTINTHDLSDKERQWLTAVSVHQYKQTLSEISKHSGLSAGTASRIAQDCEKKNLVTVVELNFRRGKPRYPILLPKAYTFLDLKAKVPTGRGASYEHTLFQHLLAHHFSGFKPSIESFHDGKCIDVSLSIDGKLIAVEVAMTEAHEKENLEKDISVAKVDLVLIACRNVDVKKKVLAAVQTSEHFNKCFLTTLSEVLSTDASTFSRLLSGSLKLFPDESEARHE